MIRLAEYRIFYLIVNRHSGVFNSFSLMFFPVMSYTSSQRASSNAVTVDFSPTPRDFKISFAIGFVLQSDLIIAEHFPHCTVGSDATVIFELQLAQLALGKL